MKTFKVLTIIFLGSLLVACGGNSGSKKNNFSITTNAKNNAMAINQTLELAIKNPKKLEIESVNYTLDGKTVTEKTELANFKLGEHIIEATVTYDGEKEIAKQKITLLNSVSPKLWKLEVINTYPHNTTSFTQGLEFVGDTLYESTGQYGESKLMKVNYKTGEILNKTELSPDYFGEGISILNNTVYQLTWQKKKGFTYNLNTLERKSSFNYGQSKEGWGLCNNGEKLFKSDGTAYIWQLNPDTLVEEGSIQAYTNKGKIGRLNELEFVNGKLYSNMWEFNGIAVINPTNGAVEAVINAEPLTKLIKNFSKNENCLNGIAYNSKTQTLFVTGKRWDKLFEVKIIE